MQEPAPQDEREGKAGTLCSLALRCPSCCSSCSRHAWPGVRRRLLPRHSWRNYVHAMAPPACRPCIHAVRPACAGPPAVAQHCLPMLTCAACNHHVSSRPALCSRAVRPAGGGCAAAADVPRVLFARLPAQLQPAAGESSECSVSSCSQLCLNHAELPGVECTGCGRASHVACLVFAVVARQEQEQVECTQTACSVRVVLSPLHCVFPSSLQSWPNQNKKEEVERIKNTLLEQLQQLRGAPGACYFRGGG